jgi:methyl-accepting chemotaxis protein
VIDEITFMIDLLALSAAVESARADEGGKIVVQRKKDEAAPP